MKRIKQITAFVLIMCLCAFAAPAMAENEWSEEYYRIIDFADVLTDSEVSNLDEKCVESVSSYHIDIICITANSEDYEEADLTMEEFGRYEYETYGFGYGSDKDGVIIVYDVEKNDLCYVPNGAAEDMLPSDFLDKVETASLEELDENGVWGVLFVSCESIKNRLSAVTGIEITKDDSDGETAEVSVEAESSVSGESSSAQVSSSQSEKTEMPYWYPENTDSWVEFHNENASRVVDDADIFSDVDEQTMKDMIAEIADKYNKDVVIYTSNSSYGLGEKTLAMDFYDFCGYGYGNTYEGICLCFVMDPADRGFAVSANGAETRTLYTQGNADDMDDRLYEFVASTYTDSGEEIKGDYAAGVIDWISNVETMFETGYAFVPDWYLGTEKDSERVTTDYDVFTDQELSDLKERCQALSEKTGIDIAIHSSDNMYWMDMDTYAKAYYEARDYGTGDSKDGVLLLISRDGLFSTGTVTYVNGTPLRFLTDSNLARLNKRANNLVEEHTSYEVASQWLNDFEHLNATGRIARPIWYWILIAVCGCALGAIFAGIMLHLAVKKMKKPVIQDMASDYLLPGTLRVTKNSDSLIGTRVERRSKPKEYHSSGGSSSSSSSSHKSSYSSHSVGSSGRSHTTSGRKF